MSEEVLQERRRMLAWVASARTVSVGVCNPLVFRLWITSLQVLARPTHWCSSGRPIKEYFEQCPVVIACQRFLKVRDGPRHSLNYLLSILKIIDDL